MQDTSKRIKAMQTALSWHEGEQRKYTGAPFVTHPAAVAATLAALDFPDHVVAAGWLHDAIEHAVAKGRMKMKEAAQALADEVGEDVVALVMEVTPVSIGAAMKRAERKALDGAHYAAASAVGQSLHLADMLDNIQGISILAPKFAPIYLAEKRAEWMALRQGDSRLRALVDKELRLQGH